MKFEIYGEKVNISEGMREKIEDKLSVLSKYLLIDPETTARVVCKTYSNDLKVEITIPTKIGILRSEVINHDFFTAVDLSIDKLEDQIRKQKSRLSRRHKDGLAAGFASEAEAAEMNEEPVRTKSITADEMSLDEAIMQMEMLDHSFFIYRDNESDKIAVVYKRIDGDYGLIEVDD